MTSTASATLVHWIAVARCWELPGTATICEGSQKFFILGKSLLSFWNRLSSSSLSSALGQQSLSAFLLQMTGRFHADEQRGKELELGRRASPFSVTPQEEGAVETQTQVDLWAVTRLEAQPETAGRWVGSARASCHWIGFVWLLKGPGYARWMKSPECWGMEKAGGQRKEPLARRGMEGWIGGRRRICTDGQGSGLVFVQIKSASHTAFSWLSTSLGPRHPQHEKLQVLTVSWVLAGTASVLQTTRGEILKWRKGAKYRHTVKKKKSVNVKIFLQP